ncbi:hypothetical protein [Neorhizobium sp. S3-V5DH]|uniref:hypothetical protein n=1 Tax=Neorhizobium sp. S3-V5DH TaxID=2485166 RepID=UPI00104FE109|nr:hypothetical protein [Neorhizobium sp. S3-V5DH]TCV66315.1 hypothetical protein EDE09_11666 [Neorhizobium sp. S3-V5DH]
MITYFVVQSFTRGKRGALLPDIPIQATDQAHAFRMLDRLAAQKAGVVAFSRSGDPATGEYTDAVILGTYGDLPDEAAEMAA